MREIKFRGMTELGEWKYGLLTFMFGQYAIVDPVDENSVYLIDKETVGQYTGLKYKDGVEIYEGDIVKDRFENIFKVSFNPEFCAYFLYPKEDPEEFMAIYPKIILTVIGNIYESPDLLGGSS